MTLLDLFGIFKVVNQTRIDVMVLGPYLESCHEPRLDKQKNKVLRIVNLKIEYFTSNMWCFMLNDADC